MEIKEYTKFKADEILQLYTQVGWTAYTEDMPALERGYKNSLLVLAAYENGELLGIVRVALRCLRRCWNDIRMSGRSNW